MEKTVVLNVEYVMKPGGARAFVRELEELGVLQDIRSHEGCLKYDYYLPLDGGDNLLLIERWTSQRALDKHQASPCMTVLRQVKGKYTADSKAEKFTLA